MTRSLAKFTVVWICCLLSVPSSSQIGQDLSVFQSLAEHRHSATAAQTARDFAALLSRIGGDGTEAQLQAVNDFFNERIAFESDQQIWGQEDYWASPLETITAGAGDCEDFTIAKFTALRLLGVPLEKLRLTYVKAKIGGPSSRISQAHMVLTYYPNPGDIPLVLDNLVHDIRPANQRPDLTPVFGFNSEGLWVGSQSAATQYDPKLRLSRWRSVLQKIHNEGLGNP